MTLSLRPPRLKPWVRSHVETAGHFRIFDVLKADMVLPNGEPCPHPIYTFSCATWCNVLAFTPANEAVFVWQYRHGTDTIALEMPGGVVDLWEAPMEGARRELREETGYAIEQLETLMVVHPNPAIQGNTHHTFLGWGAQLAGAPKFDPGEECEVALIPIGDLEALVDEGHVTHVLCVSAIERFLRMRSKLGKR
jgi:ADP-ribose pyrophosphatase YjhB (NUDIX family)